MPPDGQANRTITAVGARERVPNKAMWPVVDNATHRATPLIDLYQPVVCSSAQFPTLSFSRNTKIRPVATVGHGADPYLEHVRGSRGLGPLVGPRNRKSKMRDYWEPSQETGGRTFSPVADHLLDAAAFPQ